MTSEFDARLFGPGLPAAGSAANLSFQASRLVASHAQGEAEAPTTAVSLARAGFDQRGLALRWQDDSGQWEAHLDAATAERLQTAPPAGWEALFNSHRTAKRKTDRRRALGWSAIGLWVAAPLLLLIVFVLNAGHLAGWAAGHIDVKHEAQLGDLSFAQMKAGLKLLPETHAAHRAVAEIGTRLTSGSRYQYRWHVAEDKSVNAYALPGGIIVVHSGLIATAGDAEELAGVLAHEISHVELRHSLRNLVQGLGMRALMGLALGDWTGAAGDAAAQLTELKFSRDAEREADQGGFDRLVKHGIDPTGMERFFARLAKDEKLNLAFLSTHPSSAERLAAMRALTDSAPKQAYSKLPYAWPLITPAEH